MRDRGMQHSTERNQQGQKQQDGKPQAENGRLTRQNALYSSALQVARAGISAFRQLEPPSPHMPDMDPGVALRLVRAQEIQTVDVLLTIQTAVPGWRGGFLAASVPLRAR